MAEVSEKLVQTMAVHGYMPAAQAAERVGVAVSTLYRAVQRGAVEGFKAGDSGLWFVRRASLAGHYGPQVAKACGLDVLLEGEDPNAKPLPTEAPSRPAKATDAAGRAKGAPSKASARKAPPRGAKTRRA